MQTNEVVVDVSTVIPRERHPRVFAAWHALADGAAMVLVNDHDPVPLYYQFAAEYRGCFKWEYLMRGPDLWKVRLGKGNYADPGFAPGLKSASSEVTVAGAELKPLVLDVRPIFERGGSPCSSIDEAVASLAPRQSFVLLVPFEPAPLFAKLGAKGLSHRSEQMPDGSYRIEFTPGGTPALSGTPVECNCGGH